MEQRGDMLFFDELEQDLAHLPERILIDYADVMFETVKGEQNRTHINYKELQSLDAYEITRAEALSMPVLHDNLLRLKKLSEDLGAIIASQFTEEFLDSLDSQ